MLSNLNVIRKKNDSFALTPLSMRSLGHCIRNSFVTKCSAEKEEIFFFLFFLYESINNWMGIGVFAYIIMCMYVYLF